MRTKRFLILALIGVNLILLAGLFILSYDLPEADAQSRGASGKYAAVTAQYTGGTDALYILHTGRGILLAIIPAQDQSGRMQWPPTLRDVNADMGG